MSNYTILPTFENGILLSDYTKLYTFNKRCIAAFKTKVSIFV